VVSLLDGSSVGWVRSANAMFSGLLVNWGCERADEMDVEAYLEATPMGRPLYERYGFVAVKEVEFCTGKAHGDEMLTFIVSFFFSCYFWFGLSWVGEKWVASGCEVCGLVRLT
jgi:hypothetical protein